MGTRLREETEFRPKPMVEIGNRPILWHIMKIYSTYGFSDFILCLGYKGEIIKDYFYHYATRNSDFTIELSTREIEFHNSRPEENWRVTLVDTGDNAMTGARIKRVEKYIDEDLFMVTYGDGVTDLDIRKLLAFHKSHGKIGTVTGVHPPSRYGELRIVGNTVYSFREKPQEEEATINGGYFVFKRKFFDYLSADDGCILERAPLENLAAKNQLKVYQHMGFWQCMDTYRDLKLLNEIWASGKVPWRVW